MKKHNKQDVVEEVIIEIISDFYEENFVRSFSNKISALVIEKNTFTLDEIIGDESSSEVPLCIFINTDNLKTEYSDINSIFQEHKNEEYSIYILLDSVRDIVRIKNELKMDWKKNLKGVNKSDGSIKYVHIPNTTELIFPINITSCINNLEFSSFKQNFPSEMKHKGCVYTCKLEDLIEIYNKIGSTLFERNLRYKISDTNDVEEYIGKTLYENPEDFWFNNNGVSMLAYEELFVFNKEKQITYNARKTTDLQVINGAQTISCSTELYYQLEYTISEKQKEIEQEQRKTEIDEKKINDLEFELKELNKKKTNISKANVLLRIIYIEANDKDESFAKDVSIALNRQKPIKNTDIKFFTPEIQYINDLYKDNGNVYPYFHILKSGEEPTNPNCCDLITFAKIYAIYFLQKPGTARNGKGSLLSKNNWNFIVLAENKKKDKKELMEYFETRLRCFTKIYQLWLNIKTILEILQKELQDTNEKEICKYSSEYFTAYLADVLNEEKQDYKEWKYDDSYIINEGNLKTVISEIVTRTNLFYKSKKIYKIESNHFKTDNTYNELKQYLKQIKDLNIKILVIFEKEEKGES